MGKMEENLTDEQIQVLPRAFEFLAQGKQKESLALLHGALSKRSGSKRILYHIGFVYRTMNDLDNAEKYYLKAIAAIDTLPNDGIYCQLGILYQLKEDYEKAVRAFEMAIEANGGYANAYSGLGITYRKMGDYEKALQTYERGREALIRAAIKKASGGKGRMSDTEESGAMKNGRCRNEEVRKALESSLDYSLLCSNEGRAYVELGRIEEAKRSFRESIEFIPVGVDYRDPYIALEELG